MTPIPDSLATTPPAIRVHTAAQINRPAFLAFLDKLGLAESTATTAAFNFAFDLGESYANRE